MTKATRVKYNNIRARRSARVRKKIGRGTSAIPRLSIFRSNRYIYAQLIDDKAGTTLLSVSSQGMKTKGIKTKIAEHVGELLATAAAKANIATAVVDRGSYQYHGRVKALVEGARKKGLRL